MVRLGGAKTTSPKVILSPCLANSASFFCCLNTRFFSASRCFLLVFLLSPFVVSLLLLLVFVEVVSLLLLLGLVEVVSLEEVVVGEERRCKICC